MKRFTVSSFWFKESAKMLKRGQKISNESKIVDSIVLSAHFVVGNFRSQVTEIFNKF